MRIVFGMDGGGTHCRIALADSGGHVLQTAEGPSSNMYAVGREAAVENVLALLESTLRSCGVSKEDIAAGCLGSAGLSRLVEIAFFREAFEKEIPGCPVHLGNDAEISLIGRLGSLSGISLISGTGSICLDRNLNGITVRSGGLG